MDSNAQVNIRLTKGSSSKCYHLLENGDSVDCRYPYDEDNILSKSVLNIDKKSIALTRSTGFTFCENFVALNKYLLESIYPDAKGKWYFTRLEQSFLIPDNSVFTVVLKKNFKFRLTQSDIFVNGENVGSVYFTLVRGEA